MAERSPINWISRRVAVRVSTLALVLGAAACAPLQWPWPNLLDSAYPGISMEPANGSRDVDPGTGIRISAEGSGAELRKVEVRDADGKPVAGRLERGTFVVEPPLQFGTRYRVTAVAANLVGLQVERQFELTTATAPRLAGGPVYRLDREGAVKLAFDRPVGRFEIAGNLDAKIEPDADRRTFRVVASRYPKGSTIPVEVRCETPSGVPLPVLALQFSSAEPLQVTLSLQGQTDLGLALPVELRFAEVLAERDKVPDGLVVQTEDGAPVGGRWQWVAGQRLRFTPRPQWPASSTIQVRAEPGRIQSVNGRTNADVILGSFATGADRRIVIYLDTQRLAAIENGQVVRTIKVSTGKAATPTVTGSYYIYARYPRKTMRSLAKPGEPGHYVVENVPYAQYFHADYALHGAWWHNGFGRPASHGCVNIPTRTNNRRWPKSPEEAGWLYDWAALGVPVTVQRTASR